MGQPSDSILISAGIPGRPALKLEHGKPYPSTTIDMAKIFAELGFSVSFEDERDERSYVTFNAAEYWLPIITVTTTILMAGAGNLLSEAIIRFLGGDKSRKNILHVEYRITDNDGITRYFKASGETPDVLSAIDKFEDGLDE